VVVAGFGAGPGARELAEAAGWPLLAEPGSGAWGGGNLVAAGRLLVEAEPLASAIERVVVFGRPVLSRPITNLVTRRDVALVVVHPGGGSWFDLGRQAGQVVGAVRPVGPARPGEAAWLEQWRRAGQLTWEGIQAHLPASGIGVAHRLALAAAEAGDPLMVGASNALRDLDLTPAPPGLTVFASRGVAGIDGTVATATGLALGIGHRVRVLLGDLSLLHDCGALAVPTTEVVPNLQVVVLNDAGGGIFETLEVAAPGRRAAFERFFAVPVPADLAQLAAGFGAAYARAESLDEVARLVAAPAPGIQVVEVPLDRAARAGQGAALADLARQAAAAG
jgi:2-succinyl-5-enolpyruvyl-6-hydroxy-3-cyclohexene-1-carboxylate synthase